MTYLPTKAEKGISNLISVIFHPLLFPSYLFLALFSMNHYFSLSVPLMAKLLILAMVFTISLILPLLFFLLFKHFRIIESLEMKKREEEKKKRAEELEKLKEKLKAEGKWEE